MSRAHLFCHQAYYGRTIRQCDHLPHIRHHLTSSEICHPPHTHTSSQNYSHPHIRQETYLKTILSKKCGKKQILYARHKAAPTPLKFAYNHQGSRSRIFSGRVSTIGSRCMRSINAESLIAAGPGFIRAIREQNARKPPSGRSDASQTRAILNA